MVTIIVAVGRDGAIGRKGNLAFHLREDMRHFKALTTGHTVVMGRKTFESLPKGALPDRRNIVITRNDTFKAPGVERASSLEDALQMAAGDEIFIIGGGEIYRQAMPHVDRLELTEINADTPDADTFFPEIDYDCWRKESDSGIMIDEKSGIPFRFICYCRR